MKRNIYTLKFIFVMIAATSIFGCTAKLNIINIFVEDSVQNLMERDTGVFDFGMVFASKSSSETFTIRQDSIIDIKITGAPMIAITGSGASAFRVTLTPAKLIKPDSSSPFTIKFSPTSPQVYSATVTIENDDDTENPYIFEIIGRGYITNFDFNGDNIDDWLVGAYADDDNGNASGSAYIFFGATNLTATLNASDADVKIIGDDIEDLFGFSVSPAGDFNNDGIDDIIASALYDDDGGAFSGNVFIFFGSLNPASLLTASDADVKIIGADINDRFGISVSYAGDFNNDQISDVIVGSWLDDDGAVDSGCAYIFYGSSNPASIIDASNADVILVGGNEDDRFGQSVSYAGDFNNDGIDDVIVGVRHDDDGGSNSGGALIYFGSSNPPAIIEESNADVKFIGGDSEDYFGFSVSNAGDFNADGIDDVIIGSYLADNGGTNSGSAYVFFGSINPASIIDASEADIIIAGEEEEDFFGFTVSMAGDFNDDGINDVIVGAYFVDKGGEDSGSAYIFFGTASPVSTIDASNADVIIVGEDEEDLFGYSVSSAGDCNVDGRIDVVVGARFDDEGDEDSGCVFIFLGRTDTVSTVDASDADVKIAGDDEDDFFGYSVSGGK